MKIRFPCPACDEPGRLDLTTPADWQCSACDYRLHVDAAPVDKPLSHCALCGNNELYRKKNFPHWLGMLLLSVACLAFLITNYLYQQWWAWGILLGSALVDALLYLAVGDVVVCYRCGAQHRGFAPNQKYQPYEISIGERYRQEEIRRQQMLAEKRAGG